MLVLFDERVPGGRESPRLVRTQVRSALAGRVDPDDLATVLLVVSELVTNSVLHVGSQLRVRLLGDDAVLRVEVADDSPRLPITRRTFLGTEVSGRGLPLVDRLSNAWGAEPAPSGKLVWSELEMRVREPVATGPTPHRPPGGRPW